MNSFIARLQSLFHPTPKQAPKDLSGKTVQKILRLLSQTTQAELSCDDVHELLDEYADYTMNREDAARLLPFVQQHLAMCPDCLEEYESLLKCLQGSVE